jgi:hypothetical protein
LEEKKKMGRPIKNTSPRVEKLTLRLSEDEISDIQYCADKLKVSRTDAIVKGIEELKKKV